MFYLCDPLGNVDYRLHPNGNLIDASAYDAYGTVTTYTTIGGQLTEVPCTDPYQYKGQFGYYTDIPTGLILCTARYYDPTLGRWLTRDPIGYDGGMNQYGYCGGDPVNLVDPDGKWATLVAILVAGGMYYAVIGPTMATNMTAIDAWSLGEKGEAAFLTICSVAGPATDGLLRIPQCLKSLKILQPVSKEGDFIVGSCKELKAATAGIARASEIAVHHLIETRFAQALGLKANEISSVILTIGIKGEHQILTNAMRARIPYGTKLTAEHAQEIMEAIRQVYKDHPALLKEIKAYIKEVRPDLLRYL